MTQPDARKVGGGPGAQPGAGSKVLKCREEPSRGDKGLGASSSRTLAKSSPAQSPGEGSGNLASLSGKVFFFALW